MLRPLLALATLALVAHAADDLEKYQERRREVLVEAGQRHLELGLWARDRGLVPQATNELFLAVETSEGAHYGAGQVLSLLRSLDDAFWKQRRPKPSSGSLSAYDRKATEALRDDQQAFLALGEWALKRDLVEQARAEYVAILKRLDAPLEFDGEGRIVLAHGLVSAAVAAWIREGAVAINGRLYLRDEFLEHLPDVGEIFEASSDALRVRATTSAADALALHAIGSALMQVLEAELLGRPTRRLNVFVFAEHAQYTAYLTSAGYEKHAVADGFASSSTLTAVVDAEEKDEARVQAHVLHELTHLFGMGLSRGVLPSWYHEGLAELYGGQGTITWDGTALSTKGHLQPGELALLRDPAALMSLEELLTGDALTLLAKADRKDAQRFYAQSWALVRFLRADASKPHRELFAEWEARCLGAAVGADAKGGGARNAVPAQVLFRELFDGELAALEEDYRVYLTNL